jgi:hypothetical protein
MHRTFQLPALLAFDLGAIASTPAMPTFFARRDYTGLYNGFVRVADTNGNGIPDLISSQFGVMRVEFRNGDGTFRTGTGPTTVAEGAFSFAAIDLNGDGRIDLAMADQSSVAVSIGNGDGTFTSAALYSINDSQIACLL